MPRIIQIIIFCSVFAFLFPRVEIAAQESEKKDEKKGPEFIKKVEKILNGFTIGRDTRVFPYVSLEDWFDPFGGLKLGHPSWNSIDKVYHHFKFENFHDYSWKFRYLSNSLSSENTKLSFLLKLKLDRDPFFYGIGNSTSKSGRSEATYSSIFFGGEIKQNISNTLVLRWSPGFWKFKSGLVKGGEFEESSDAQYLSSRFTLSDRKSVDYWEASFDNQWSAFVEIALPINTSATSYSRFNLQTLTNLPFVGSLKLRIATRVEYLISSNRNLVPYFALPEAGSRSGLRGFSKERFRNYAISVYNLEFSFSAANDLDVFLFSDIAQTASNPIKLPGNQLHTNVGLGFRIRKTRHPLSFGVAASHEKVKLFVAIAVGSPW